MRLFVRTEPMNATLMIGGAFDRRTGFEFHVLERFDDRSFVGRAFRAFDGRNFLVDEDRLARVDAPHVYRQREMSSASMFTTSSYDASASLATAFQRATAASQALALGEYGRPFKYANVISSGFT